MYVGYVRYNTYMYIKLRHRAIINTYMYKHQGSIFLFPWILEGVVHGPNNQTFQFGRSFVLGKFYNSKSPSK